MCSICRIYNSVLASIMTYHPISNKSNTAGATIGAPEFISSCFSGVLVSHCLVFCVVFCRSLFVLFHLAIVLCCLSFDLQLLITTFHFKLDNECNRQTPVVQEFFISFITSMYSALLIYEKMGTNKQSLTFL
jgi:hypothetical protein